MKKNCLLLILLFSVFLMFSQEGNRIQQIKNNLEVLAVDTKGLSEKVNVNITSTTLSNLLLAVAKIHKVNINLEEGLGSRTIVNNFADVTVSDLLVFLCKEYDLNIDFIGNILSIKPYKAPPKEKAKRIIPINYDPALDLLDLDLKNDTLFVAFKEIINKTGKNLVFAPELQNRKISFFIKETPFDAAMNKLAFANNLSVSKTRDGFFMFEDNTPLTSANNAASTQSQNRVRPRRRGNSNFYFKVLDSVSMTVEVDFENTPIENIIYDIGADLGIDIFTATPLAEAGNASFKAKRIHFDELLIDLFEAGTDGIQNQPNTANRGAVTSTGTQSQKQGTDVTFTFKKDGSIYFFGTNDQLSVREVEVIPMRFRSIEILGDPAAGTSRSVGRTFTGLNNGFQNYYGGLNQGGFNGQNSFGNNQGFNNGLQNRNSRQNTSLNNTRTNNTNAAQSQNLLELVPDELTQGLDIRSDSELNSFVVSGPSQGIIRFKKFVKHLDKPVPVVLIEVMIIEVSRSATVETGIEWGIGQDPVNTEGNIFPNADITFGAETVNKVIGGFSGLGNLGKVVPEFFARVKAMEANGNIKIRSTPKLATLNGHQASFSSGTTTYYAITSRNIFGTDNPQSSEIRNFVPIDAELGITIKPIVSGDGQVTLNVFVIQSDFNGERIDEDAPPGINSREFSSSIRVRNQDLVVLGGLEEKLKNDSGSGVPFLARIPVIKWLFSKRKREDSRKRLTVLIKPTVIK